MVAHFKDLANKIDKKKRRKELEERLKLGSDDYKGFLEYGRRL